MKTRKPIYEPIPEARGLVYGLFFGTLLNLALLALILAAFH